MTAFNHTKTIVWGQIGMLGLLLLLLLCFSSGLDPFWVSLSFVLLVAYHLASTILLGSRPYRSPLQAWIHLGCYLLLCSFLLWATTRPDEESLFWFVSLLPIVMAASRLSLAGTTLVATVAGLAYFLLLPEGFIIASDFWVEFPEFVLICVTYLFVGLLVQTLSSEARNQLQRQQDLNRELSIQKNELSRTLAQLSTAEQQLRRRDRLAALGEMAAGIAHEIRNPLGIITSTAQLLQNRKQIGHNTEELLNIIREESTRLNKLINDFLAFGRDTHPNLQPCDLKELVARTADGFQQVTEQAGVTLRLNTPNTVTARADGDMLRQVLLNLLLNAVQACSPGQEITISLDQTPAKALLQVADTGHGIDPKLHDKIFNPFFTTRDKGTGLGLANAHKLIEAQGGELHFSSTPNRGSVFTISLPLEEHDDEPHPDR
ncbi:signal transduction histidine kinase [Geothermobacter ehrlichii]|uniref:histidine kinase n=1 Tax=Geothermobacter ehrlichii TaxID=213224 RepID=A0A5D3WIJ2_9BACT|nr:ATP-binding protein [Geothermobacter ehrlichii]TYO97697.1 signal transduction histidine kinase [Geothermobacter ehrlichii]